MLEENSELFSSDLTHRLLARKQFHWQVSCERKDANCKMYVVEQTGLLRQLVVGGGGRERRWDGAYNINSFTARVL